MWNGSIGSIGSERMGVFYIRRALEGYILGSGLSINETKISVWWMAERLTSQGLGIGPGTKIDQPEM